MFVWFELPVIRSAEDTVPSIASDDQPLFKGFTPPSTSFRFPDTQVTKKVDLDLWRGRSSPELPSNLLSPFSGLKESESE